MTLLNFPVSIHRVSFTQAALMLFVLALFSMTGLPTQAQTRDDYLIFPADLDTDRPPGSSAPVINGVEGISGACPAAALWYSYGFTPNTDDRDSQDYFTIILWDGNGTPLNANLRRQPTTGRQATGDVRIAMAGISVVPVYITLYDIPYFETGNLVDFALNRGTLLANVTIDPTTLIPDCRTLIFGDFPMFEGFEDDRIGHLGGDAAVYVRDTSIVVYGIDNQSGGHPVVEVDIAGLDVPAQPLVNTLIASSEDGLYQVYILTTGEYQVNIGPDAEGEVRVLIFRGLVNPQPTAYQYNFNIYDE